MSELTSKHLAADLLRLVDKLSGIAEEVSTHVTTGNLDGAALVLGTQSGKVHQLNEAYTALQAKVEEEGGDVERALQQG
jgi:hypothetical protein